MFEDGLSVGICILSVPIPAVSVNRMALQNMDKARTFPVKNNYFTSSDPHHDMLGGGFQVRVVIRPQLQEMKGQFVEELRFVSESRPAPRLAGQIIFAIC